MTWRDATRVRSWHHDATGASNKRRQTSITMIQCLPIDPRADRQGDLTVPGLWRQLDNQLAWEVYFIDCHVWRETSPAHRTHLIFWLKPRFHMHHREFSLGKTCTLWRDDKNISQVAVFKYGSLRRGTLAGVVEAVWGCKPRYFDKHEEPQVDI